MRVLSTILTFLTLALSAHAQINISTNDMPQAGDTFRVSIGALDTAVFFGFERQGANLSWDFSNLEPFRQDIIRYESSANTPYANDIRNRIGEKVADTLSFGVVELFDVYDFYNSSASDYSQDYRAASIPTGLSFPFPPALNITPLYTDKDEIYQFPLNYLDRDSSNFDFNYNNSLIQVYWGSRGYRINEVDAWGSIITPYDTFSTIRVVTDVVSFDTISFAGTSLGLPSHTREYKWLTNNLHIPALTLSGNVIGDVFIPINVEYLDSIRDVPLLFAPTALFNADTIGVALNDTGFFNNFSFSIPAANYEWSISPNTHQYVSGTSTSSQNPEVVFSDTGRYDVQLIVRNANGSDTLLREDYIDVFNDFTFISEIKGNEVDIRLFPNPAKEGSILNIKNLSESNIDHILIFNLQGQLVKEIQLPNLSNEFTIPIQGIRRGQYLFQFTSKGEPIASKPIQIK